MERKRQHRNFLGYDVAGNAYQIDEYQHWIQAAPVADAASTVWELGRRDLLCGTSAVSSLGEGRYRIVDTGVVVSSAPAAKSPSWTYMR